MVSCASSIAQGVAVTPDKLVGFGIGVQLKIRIFNKILSIILTNSRETGSRETSKSAAETSIGVGNLHFGAIS